MKIVINKCYGGFGISEAGLRLLNLKNYWDVERTDERLIELVESGVDVNGFCAELEVVEIPDEATDWELDEYDGLESITYVVDGKLYHA